MRGTVAWHLLGYDAQCAYPMAAPQLRAQQVTQSKPAKHGLGHILFGTKLRHVPHVAKMETLNGARGDLVTDDHGQHM